MRIAIIGAGISRLGVAPTRYHRDHEIAVFEAADRAGGHANTFDVDTDDGRFAVDTGFIVFNDRNYPNFERILDELGVASQPSQMSFGVSDGADFEYNGASPNGLFAYRAHLWNQNVPRDRARPDPLQPRRSGTARLRRRSDARPVARAARLLGCVHRSPDRSPGQCRVVDRPRPDVVVPGPLPRRVLRQSRDVRVPPAAALADDHRRLARVRRCDHATLARSATPRDAG